MKEELEDKELKYLFCFMFASIFFIFIILFLELAFHWISVWLDFRIVLILFMIVEYGVMGYVAWKRHKRLLTCR